MSRFTEEAEAALGITHAAALARYYRCALIRFQTRAPHATITDHHAEVLQFQEGGLRQRKGIRVRRPGVTGLKASRQAHLEAAIRYAQAQRLGDVWVPSGFRDTWIPEEARQRVRADLARWRREQRQRREAGQADPPAHDTKEKRCAATHDSSC